MVVRWAAWVMLAGTVHGSSVSATASDETSSWSRPDPFRPPYAAIDQLFTGLDRNSSGTLEEQEVGNDLNGQRFIDVDIDADGGVSLEEWKHAFLHTWDRAPMHTELLAEYFVWLMSEAMKVPDLDGALRIGREGLTAFPESYRLNLNVGWLAHTMGELDLAEECAVVGASIRPDRSDALCLQATVERSRGAVGKEEALLRQASTLPGHNPCGELTLARRYMGKNDPRAAYGILLDALHRDGWAPKVDKELRLPLGQAAFDLGLTQEAGYHALRAVSLDTRSRRAWQLLADYFRRSGHVELSNHILRGIAEEQAQQPTGERQ